MNKEAEEVMDRMLSEYNQTVNDMHKFKLSPKEVSLFTKAMEHHAKQEIMHFDYWRTENYFQVMPNGYENKIADYSANHQRRYTRHELYELYIQSKNNNTINK